MIEPIAIFSHHNIPGGKHIIFDCGNGYGLSVRTAPGRDHGLYCYCDEGLPTQYEALLIKCREGNLGFIPLAEPQGWLYIEEIGEIIEAIQQKGKDGWPSWNTPYEE